MSFNPTAFNTRQHEVNAIHAAAGSLLPGQAIKRPTQIPTGLTPATDKYQVEVAAAADEVYGVVSSQVSEVSPTTTGRVVLLKSSPLIAVLLSANVAAGDKLKVKTMDGKWATIGMGETGIVTAAHAGSSGELIWAWT